MGKIKQLLQSTATKVIRCYQLTLSPYVGPCCRFYPSCSEYGLIALKTHGFLRGLLLILKRVSKCHPFHSGGVDLVPPANKNNPPQRYTRHSCFQSNLKAPIRETSSGLTSKSLP